MTITPPAHDRHLRAGAQLRKRGIASFEGAALERRGERRAPPAHFPSRGDSPSPARRSASSVARSRTSSAPMPGGPPSLWAETAMKSASGSGILPALCAQSASSSDPPSRTRAAMSSSGWITPVSLLTCWIATSAGPLASTASSAAASIRPSPPTGMIPTLAPIAATTIACSVAPRARPATLARAATISIASLAPEVKMTS